MVVFYIKRALNLNVFFWNSGSRKNSMVEGDLPKETKNGKKENPTDPGDFANFKHITPKTVEVL